MFDLCGTACPGIKENNSFRSYIRKSSRPRLCKGYSRKKKDKRKAKGWRESLEIKKLEGRQAELREKGEK